MSGKERKESEIIIIHTYVCRQSIDQSERSIIVQVQRFRQWHDQPPGVEDHDGKTWSSSDTPGTQGHDQGGGEKIEFK